MSAAGQAPEAPVIAEVKTPLAGLFHAIRNRRSVRRLLFVCWLLICAAILLIGVELVSRRYLVPWHHEIGNRHLQPYFMSGGYYQSSMARFKDKNVMLGPGGPESYGYFRSGDIYLYNFEKEVDSIQDRGDFLFQDRVELANDVDRSDALRIFVVGGSTAYGIGATSPDKRWFVVLERALAKELGRDVRIIPAAMIGYVSTQERVALNLMVLPRRPDAVIIFDGFNDAVIPSIFGTRPGDPYDQGIFYQDFYSPLAGAKKWVAGHSYFYRFLLYRSLARSIDAHQQRILNDPRLLQNYASSAASVYLDNVSHMLEQCKEKDLPCPVFVQPARDVTLRNQGKQEDLDPFTLSAYEAILAGINHPRFEGQIHDLTRVFNEQPLESEFFDNVHFRDRGHEVIANAMLPVLLEELGRTQKSQQKQESTELR